MKKIIIALLLISLLLPTLASCIEHTPPITPPVTPGETPDDDDPGNGSTPGEGELTFTASLTLGGSAYSPQGASELKVRWSDGRNAHTAPVGADGKASIKGLDGDYTVTLLGLPAGYTYNPNIYKADNDNRDVNIELIKLTTTLGTGADLYKCINLTRTGYYRAELKSERSVVYYQFSPSKAGVYKVESMMDISANMYNPILRPYTGTSAAKFEQDEIDGGGVSGSYTKNFLYTIVIPEEYRHNSYTFAIRVEGQDAVYPTYVDFNFSYAGETEDVQHASGNIVIPEEIPAHLNYFDMVMYESMLPEHLTADDLNNPTYIWLKEYKEYLAENMTAFGTTWIDAAERVDGKKVFNQLRYKLNPDDGYYHLYDDVKYAATGGYGPILYADIATPCLFIESPLSTIEYAGNKTLTVSEGEENYKLFVEGTYELTLSHGDSGPYFCNNTCPCYKTYETAKNAFLNAVSQYSSAAASGSTDIQTYIQSMRRAKSNLLSTNGGICDNTCSLCNSGCRHLPINNRFRLGYANISVDGRAPVTEELAVFLQKLSESQRYFSDGNGWIEGQGYTAFEDSQWLFACGYYTEN